MTANCASPHMLFFKFVLTLEVLRASATVFVVKGRVNDMIDLIGMVNDTRLT